MTEDHSIVHEKRTRWVAIIAGFTMFAEIAFGSYSNSMALTAEGWHMATHVFAIGLTWLAYFFTRTYSMSGNSTYDRKKILAISGFASAVMLQIIAIFMIIESVERLIHPKDILVQEAIYVAIAGFIVNGISALLLRHEEEHSDHNIRAAYLHVLADVLTSAIAIVALSAAMYFGHNELDAISGIAASIIITRWAILMIRRTGIELIDLKKK